VLRRHADAVTDGKISRLAVVRLPFGPLRLAKSREIEDEGFPSSLTRPCCWTKAVTQAPSALAERAAWLQQTHSRFDPYAGAPVRSA